MRKHHFIDQIHDKTSTTMNKENCYVNVGVEVEMPNSLHAGLSDVDLIMCNKDYRHCILKCRPNVALKLVNGMMKFSIAKNEQ